MAPQGLRLTDQPGSSGDQSDSEDLRVPKPLYATAAQRLITRIDGFRTRHALTRPIRVLDASGAKPELTEQVLKAGAERSVPLELTVLAESETVSALLEDLDPMGQSVEIRPETLDAFAASARPGTYDVVHSALHLTSRREVPMMTRLGKLERLSSPLFVWTDRPRGKRRKHIREIARRVDLGFCSYTKPIRSGLFTLAGERKALAPITPSITPSERDDDR